VLRRYLRHLLWLLPVSILVIFLLDRYVWLTPEQEVRRTVERGRRAAEALSVLRCEPLLTEDFTTGSGMGRGTFLYFVRAQFARLEELHADVSWEKLTFSEEETVADALLRVSLSGTDTGGVSWKGVEGDGGRFLVTLRLRKTDGKWKAFHADW